eukprot:10980920-Lingulodinium_polyedra.AAC.1
MAKGSPLQVSDSEGESAGSKYPVSMLDLNTALGHAGVPDPQRHQKVVKRPAGKRAVMMRPAGIAP